MNRTSSRRLVLALVLATLACRAHPRSDPGKVVSPPSSPAETARKAFILAAGEGEVIRRKGNTVTVKVDPKTGSPSMAMGTQLLEPGAGIPVHMHEHEDEILFIHEGHGVAVLGDDKAEVHKGGTVFIPHGVWHGVESRGEAVELLWIVTPPGLEGYFRETPAPVGTTPALTPAQLDDVGRKHGVRFKH